MGTSLSWQTDSQLHDSVQRELEWAPEIDARDVAVTAHDGVVTLTGFVDSFWQKYAVEQAVKRVRGVRAVANDVHIKLRRECTDPEIAHNAVFALKNRPGIPRTVIVTVRDGFVTLEGHVEWNYQRTDAESAVRHLDGVKGVSNAIVIEPVASVAQVQTLIEDALRRSAEIDAKHVRVEVDGGAVTLAGSVASFAEEQAAERAAWSAPGVTAVHSRLVVSP
jgi:osmotically-inducible protein OsmY